MSPALPPNVRVVTPLPDDFAGFDATSHRALTALHCAEDAHFWHRARNRFIADRLRMLGIQPPARLLELGCGAGTVTAYLASLGYAMTGVEGHLGLTLRAALRAPGASFVVHDLARGSAPVGRDFEAVGLFDVVEHLDDAEAALRGALDHVRSGGYVIGTVPALMSLWSSVDVQAGHRLRYDAAGLTRLLGALDARCVRVESFNRVLVPMMWLQRRVVVKQGDVGATSERNFKVPTAPVNSALYALVRAENKLFRRGWIPGASLWFSIQKP